MCKKTSKYIDALHSVHKKQLFLLSVQIIVKASRENTTLKEKVVSLQILCTRQSASGCLWHYWCEAAAKMTAAVKHKRKYTNQHIAHDIIYFLYLNVQTKHIVLYLCIEAPKVSWNPAFQDNDALHVMKVLYTQCRFKIHLVLLLKYQYRWNGGRKLILFGILWPNQRCRKFCFIFNHPKYSRGSRVFAPLQSSVLIIPVWRFYIYMHINVFYMANQKRPIYLYFLLFFGLFVIYF